MKAGVLPLFIFQSTKNKKEKHHDTICTVNNPEAQEQRLQINEPAGKPLKECQMKTVALTLIDSQDDQQLPYREKEASITRRWRRLMRISEEARSQGGLLTQEDLSLLLMCDVRTIRRDIAELKKDGIVIPTRGTVNDIGPGVTHKGIAICLWLEGKEPTEVAAAIHHSLKAPENYREKFKRVVYLRRSKGFTEFEISRTIGISLPATRSFLEIYGQYKNLGLFKMRMDDIELIGKNYSLAVDEKKTHRRRKPLCEAGEKDHENSRKFDVRDL